jgi:hypothetical protein
MEVWGLASQALDFSKVKACIVETMAAMQLFKSQAICVQYTKKKKKNLDLRGHGRKMEVIKICFTFY